MLDKKNDLLSPQNMQSWRGQLQASPKFRRGHIATIQLL